MPQPIVCLDERLRQYLDHWRTHFTRPQFEHFVTMLLALLVGMKGPTLSHLKESVAGSKSLASLSRFLSRAPFCLEQVQEVSWKLFQERMSPVVGQRVQEQRSECPKHRGRPRKPVVTGYLIGDDTTMHKPRGVSMQGLGRHHDSKSGERIIGHALVQGLYVLLGQTFALPPRLYRQRQVCEKEQVVFHSKIELMRELLLSFDPLEGTRTHVLLDSWYSAKVLWKAARERGFLITTALKCNRSIRRTDASAPKGWRWQPLSDYVRELPETAYHQVAWPRTPSECVWVHVVRTSIRSLYRSQLVIVRTSLDTPVSRARFWASSDLTAGVQELLGHIASRWEIEVFFEDAKELLGVDQYQLQSVTGLLRYWSLCWIAMNFLEESRHDVLVRTGHRLTRGQTRQAVQRRHHTLLVVWIYEHAKQGTASEQVCALLSA